MNTLQVSVLKTGAYLLLRLIVCQRSEEFIAASQTSLTSPPEQRSPKGLQLASTHPSLYVTHRQSFTGGHPAVSVPRSRKLHVLGEQHPWLSATSMATKKPLCDSIVVCVCSWVNPLSLMRLVWSWSALYRGETKAQRSTWTCTEGVQQGFVCLRF